MIHKMFCCCSTLKGLKFIHTTQLLLLLNYFLLNWFRCEFGITPVGAVAVTFTSAIFSYRMRPTVSSCRDCSISSAFAMLHTNRDWFKSRRQKDSFFAIQLFIPDHHLLSRLYGTKLCRSARDGAHLLAKAIVTGLVGLKTWAPVWKRSAQLQELNYITLLLIWPNTCTNNTLSGQQSVVTT
jgi:hypothetical protein